MDEIATRKRVNIGDIIRYKTSISGYRVWQVTAIHLGGEYQESVVEIETLDRLKNTQGRMLVPIQILEAFNHDNATNGKSDE